MAGIEIQNEYDLKIDDAMQVKGRRAVSGECGAMKEITKHDRSVLPDPWASPKV
jgi:hypothetical protein